MSKRIKGKAPKKLTFTAVFLSVLVKLMNWFMAAFCDAVYPGGIVVALVDKERTGVPRRGMSLPSGY